MPTYNKLVNNLWHSNIWYVKPADEWRPVKNVYTKQDDNKWHPAWTYEWRGDPWKPCSVSCGGGVQSRDIVCTRVEDGVKLPDKFCDGIPRISEQQNCNTQSCQVCFTSDPGNKEYTWSWRSISVDCRYRLGASVPTFVEGTYYVSIYVWMEQTISGNYWGRGRETRFYDRRNWTISPYNRFSGPNFMDVPAANYWLNFHTPIYLTETDFNTGSFPIYIEYGQKHWDGRRHHCVYDAYINTYANYYSPDGGYLPRSATNRTWDGVGDADFYGCCSDVYHYWINISRHVCRWGPQNCYPDYDMGGAGN